MSSLSTLLILLSYMLSSNAVIIKSVNLTSSNTNDNNAQISIGSSNVDCWTQSNEWRIDVCSFGSGCNSNTYQRGYHLEISLDNSWGFHPTKPSTISITMHSDTNLNSQSDLDLIATFSVNSNQYFSYFIALDERNPNQIYPECIDANPPTQSIANGDVKSCVESSYCSSAGCSERDCKALGGSNHDTVFPSNTANNKDNAFPMTIALENDPISGESYTRISTPSWNEWTQGCGFGEAFATNSGLQIYLALDDDGEQLQFQEFYITYSYDTDSPTTEPTSMQPLFCS